MKSQLNVIEMFDLSNKDQKQLVTELMENLGETITDYVDIDNKYLIVIRRNVDNFTYDDSRGLYHGLDVNIAIAAAVTAGGRIWMSHF